MTQQVAVFAPCTTSLLLGSNAPNPRIHSRRNHAFSPLLKQSCKGSSALKHRGCRIFGSSVASQIIFQGNKFYWHNLSKINSTGTNNWHHLPPNLNQDQVKDIQQSPQLPTNYMFCILAAKLLE